VEVGLDRPGYLRWRRCERTRGDRRRFDDAICIGTGCTRPRIGYTADLREPVRRANIAGLPETCK